MTCRQLFRILGLCAGVWLAGFRQPQIITASRKFHDVPSFVSTRASEEFHSRMRSVSSSISFVFQVSRSTGILSHFVNLNIVIPEAFILGSDEHHVDVGSIINLVCIIEKVRRTLVRVALARRLLCTRACPLIIVNKRNFTV